MADSKRHQVVDAVITALEGITKAKGYKTDIGMVSDRWQSHEQIPKKDLPAAFPIDIDEKRSPVVMPTDDNLDIEAALELLVSVVVYDKNDDTRQQRTDLMRDIEKAILNNDALDALILYIEPTGVVTDRGTVPNFSIWDQSYVITYRYNSAVGG